MSGVVAKYQQYAEYKDSGVEWLGEIPSHWDFFDGKRIFATVREQALQTDEQLAASQKYGVIPQTLMMRLNDSKVMLALKGTESFRHVEKNNFVISLRSFEGGIEHSNYTGCVSPAYTVLSGKKGMSYNFYKYLFKSAPFIAALQSTTDSLRDGKSISYEQFGRIALPIFDIKEQIQIANFLDHETAKIDSLIEKQQQLIQLLKEKRQAVISHAVTKGLNPDVPMKDSGNIWAKNIPKHWKLSRLTYIARVGNGATPSRENQAYWQDGSIGWLNSSKVNDVIITEADQFITSLAKNQTSVQVVQPNDLVIAITGEGQTRGRIAICQLDATINQHLASIRITDKNLNHEFLFYWLTANYERIRYESTGAGSTKGAITCGDIGMYPIPLPPYPEQLDIVMNIKKQNDNFKRLIAKAESAIQLMQERRTALISAAVTGKIDVRHWQNQNKNTEAKMECSA